MKKHPIDNFLEVSLLLTFLISLSFYLPGNITGQDVNDTSVLGPYITASVANRTELVISSFSFQNPLTLYDVQNITVEAQNTGSIDYDAQITETIYNLSNGTQLNQLAVYVDSSVHLYPGNTRMHKSIFVPENLGAYFIKATVHYGPRIVEVWGSFEVIVQNQTQPPGGGGNQSNQTNQTNQTQPPGGGGGNVGGGGGAGGGGGGAGGGGNGTGGNATGNQTGNETVVAIPVTPGEEQLIPANASNYSMRIEYPSRINVHRNITNLLSVWVVNNGRNSLNNIVFYASYPDVFEVDVNPKNPQRLQTYGESTTYVISIYTSNASLREYPFDFDVISQTVKSNGSVTLDVREAPESLKELIRDKIINYKVLVSQISAEIQAASLKGLDTAVPSSFINSATRGINTTQDLYDAGRYEDALTELDKVEADIKNAVFTLGNLSLRLYAVQRFDYMLLLLLLPIILLIIVWYRRRKGKRPKLLVQAKEE